MAALPSPSLIWATLTRPADLATEAGRSRDRYRRLILTALAAAGAKAITILAALVTVPLTLHYLGSERYGMWMIVSSFSMMLAFADMGLGNGILNQIAAAHGRDDRAAIRAIVSSGYAALGGIAAILLLALAIAYPLVAWDRLFNVTSPRAMAEAGPALAVFLACFGLVIPLTLVGKVQIALQQGFHANLWQGAGSLLAVTGLLAVIAAEGSLPSLVAALAGAPLAAALANTAWFFARNRDIAPKFAAISRAAIVAAGAIGLRFFVLQLIASIAYGLDSVIVAQIEGSEAVASYAVPERMFAIVSLLLAVLLQPLWPAYGEAVARGHARWVRLAVRRSILVAGTVSTAGAIVLVAFGPALLHLWVGPAVTASTLLLVGLGVWKIIESIGTTAAIYMNGAGALGFQIVVAVISGVAMVAAKIVLVHRIGVAGIPWGAAIPFVFLALIPTLAYIRRRLA